MKYKIFLNYMLLFIFILSNSIAKADEVFVYCADKDKNWKWLKFNNEYVKVLGEWGEKSTNNSSYIYYFIPKGGMKKIQKIQKNCVQAFGNDFLYPQAGSKKSNDWFIFAASSNEIFEGHATEFFKVPTTFFASKG